MSLINVEHLLRQTVGLDAAAVGYSAILHAVGARMAARSVDILREYWEFLRDSENELQELIEEIVVPETWFFRDTETFATLAKMVMDEWLPKHPVGMLRLLSFPCASGEEPYSMVMTLLDAGLSPERFRVDGVDISCRALRNANRAIYGRNSFRGRAMEFRGRYFHPTANGYHLIQSVRQQVHFQHGNLLGSDITLCPGSYDVVFCRNALIYFDKTAQLQAIDIIRELLAPGGILFVGPAETFLVAARGFQPSGGQTSASFIKGEQLRPAAPARFHRPIKRQARPGARSQSPAVLKESATHSTSIVPLNPPGESVVDLDVAARFADAGRLSEAAEICTTHLRIYGPSAAAYYLFGLVRDAQGGGDQAAELYRKAIYLDPSHADALRHLAFLKEKAGDVAAAQRLRERARRVEDTATR